MLLELLECSVLFLDAADVLDVLDVADVADVAVVLDVADVHESSARFSTSARGSVVLLRDHESLARSLVFVVCVGGCGCGGCGLCCFDSDLLSTEL